MSGTRQKTQQLSQTLVTEGRGEALVAEAEDAEPLMAKPAPESPALAEQLMEEVCDRGNLERAWKRVRSNKGGPGVDGMTIDAAKDYLREHWPNIRAQLLEGTYQPQPVKRVEIPKPDGGITASGLAYVVGVQSTLSVWPPGAEPLPPKPWSGRGRPPSRMRRDGEHGPVSAKTLAKGLSEETWRIVSWREGSNEILSSRFAAVRIRPASRDWKVSTPHPLEW